MGGEDREGNYRLPWQPLLGHLLPCLLIPTHFIDKEAETESLGEAACPPHPGSWDINLV